MSYRDLVWADGASHYWQLNEPRGTLAVDQIGGANGTISGGVTLNQPGALADGDKAMTFNGTTGKIASAATVSVPTNATIEGWIKTTITAPQPFFSNRPSGSGGTVYVGGYSAKALFIGSGPLLSGVRSIADGNWHHLAFVLDGTTCAIYVDGTFDVTGSQVRTASTGLAGLGWDGTDFWNGSIDDVAIYPVALTAAQIAAHYAAGAPAVPVTPPPIDSSEIDAALIAVLQNDATLKTLMPDGVFFGLAGPSLATGKNSTRFVLVSVMENVDRAVFGGRAIESILYLVQAVSLSGDSKGAAKRIDELLEDHPLTVAGYTFMSCAREQRIREMERDDVDPTIVWTHRGGMYRVEMSVDAASVAA